MAQETAAERIQRIAAEQKAAEVAKNAEIAANKRAEEDPAVKASRERQEREEAAADNAARAANAVALAQQNQAAAAALGMAPVSAGGAPMPNVAAREEAVQAPQNVLLDTVDSSVGPLEAPFRIFQHQYANANTIMPNGKKIIFGGQNGHIGYYSTNRPDQLDHLVPLAQTPGSMITEVTQLRDGRYVSVDDSILEAERQAVLLDSRKNSAIDLNPAVNTARANLPMTIAQNS